MPYGAEPITLDEHTERDPGSRAPFDSTRVAVESTGPLEPRSPVQFDDPVRTWLREACRAAG